MMKTAIVTDSTADIPPHLASQSGIHVVPAIMVIDGRSVADGQGISREDFYRQLPHMQALPTTAAPSSGSFEVLYESLLKAGADTVISIHVASELSGICNAATIAADAFHGRVKVVDSCHVTLGLGFQVLAAAEAAQAGFPLDKIREAIENIRQRTHLVAMLDTLEYVRRSGRVSWARANLGALLNIKPFIGLEDGKVTRLGETRMRQKGIDRLFKMLSDLGHLARLAILHTNAESDAAALLDRARELVGSDPFIVNVTSVIGVHVGPNALGFVAVTE